MKLSVIICWLAFLYNGNAAFLPDHYKTLESLLLHRMNFSADPCDDFYNYACGNFDDSAALIPIENNRILQKGLYELLNNKLQDHALSSTAIQKGLKYYQTCLQYRSNYYVPYIRRRVQMFLDAFNLPYGVFLRDVPDLWITRERWTSLLQYARDGFFVEPFFSTISVPYSLIGKKPEVESKRYLQLNDMAMAFDSKLYTCKSRKLLLKEYEKSVWGVVNVMKLIATKENVKKIAKELMEFEFKLVNVKCDNKTETGNMEYFYAKEFFKLETLGNEDWPFDIEKYLKEFIKTGAGNHNVNYDNLEVFTHPYLPYLNAAFESTPDSTILRYLYFRIVEKSTKEAPNGNCLDNLTLLPLIKSRIYTEAKYPSIVERESIRSLTTTIAGTVKNVLQGMITSMPWVKEDEATYNGLVAKFKSLKTHIAIEDHLFNNTWLDNYHAPGLRNPPGEIKFGGYPRGFPRGYAGDIPRHPIWDFFGTEGNRGLLNVKLTRFRVFSIKVNKVAKIPVFMMFCRRRSKVLELFKWFIAKSPGGNQKMGDIPGDIPRGKSPGISPSQPCHAQLNFNQVTSFLDLFWKVKNFNMYSKVRKLFSDPESFESDLTIDNAGYNPEKNKFVINDGHLIAPYFNLDYPFSFNMGHIGGSIGHEISHAFDTTGINYNNTGAYNPVLSKSAKKKMQEMVDCVIDYYSNIQVLPKTFKKNHVDGIKTVGENMADIGGLDAAYRSFKILERQFGGEKRLRHPQLRKLTHDQLFFLGFSNYWCIKLSDEVIEKLLKIDVHAPNVARVQGTMSNLPAFAKAFNCPPGSKHAPETHCKVWTV